MSVILAALTVAPAAWFLYSRLKALISSPRLNLPYVKFEGDNSRSRYRTQSATILAKGYAQQSILTQIGGPGITDEVNMAARQGLNRALDWTSLQPYPLIVKTFASMSACAIIGPELGGLESEWQMLSMRYVEAALSAPSKVEAKYPAWLYWLSRYTNDGVKAMWKYQARAAELLAPVLGARVAATQELQAGPRKRGGKGPRKFEDGVQWLYGAHTARGNQLTAEQLPRDLFVIMTASIHSTSGAGLAILIDMPEHPRALSEIRDEIARVKAANPTWTRQALGELQILDSFMREGARFHALTQYTAVQRIPTSDFTFKDGLTIPAGTTLAFPSFHHNFDPAVHPQPESFDTMRHLRKRQERTNTHRYHFASVSDDMMNWVAGRHACPGRFFAQETLKLMFIHLLTHYEFKHAEDTKESPRYLSNNLFVIANPALPVLFREKEVVSK
ncbi:Uu.00g095130.m01.CDS01 [Anthostomella pinea]|uniref:Uu.00g095130.m01.CDS01 n=1 Tax=Anthostomella pinea TaxID=933095 RepID=A0AAI8VTU1_9PEZI|nr:Uu.00g095130.m01.CDS01 [Anthostomella pinea]